MTFDAGKIRKDFPIFSKKVNGKRLVYLDNAATTQKPLQVIKAMDSYYREHNANVHRAIHQLSEEATALYEKAHKGAARFINASGMEEIIFTKNATEGLNLAAYSLTAGLKKDDEIVISQMEHHSNLVPWQQMALQRGLSLRYIPVAKTGELSIENIQKTITKKTKIVAVAHVSNTLGTINDVQKISKIAHENGALCVVDGAQGVPHLPVDVRKLGVDLLSFSGHKMLGPTGIGVLYGKKDVLEKMPPFLMGGGMIREVGWEKTSWNDLPWKFEAGTPNVAEAVGLSAAIDYLEGIGMKNVEKREQELVNFTLKKLSSIKDVDSYGPKKRAAVFSFNVKGVHAHDVSAILDSEGVAIRGGHHCTMPLMGILGVAGTSRASLSVYNTEEEIDALCAGIEKVKKVFA
jgi:cysteine desulfurase / selenocysteine lyase